MSSVLQSAKRALSGFYDRHRLVTRVVLVASAACLLRNVQIAWLYPFMIYAPSPMRASSTYSSLPRSRTSPSRSTANLTYLLGGVFRLDRWLYIAGLYLFVVLSVNLAVVLYSGSRRAGKRVSMALKRGIWAAPQKDLQRLSLAYEALYLVEHANAALQARTRQAARTPPQTRLIRAVERAERTLVEYWQPLVASSDQVLGHFLREVTIRRTGERRRTVRRALYGVSQALEQELCRRLPFRAQIGYSAWVNCVLDAPFSSSLYSPTVRPLPHPLLDRLSLFLPFVIPYPLITLEFSFHLSRRDLHHPPQDLVNSTFTPFFAALFSFVNATTALYGHDRWDVASEVSVSLITPMLHVQAVKAERKLFRAILDEVLAART
ncbi:hypothetical protein JCM8097_007644 [Rhodosporidiobolus ruineniae]